MKMENIKSISTIILLGLSILTMLTIETQMTHYALQLTVILIAILAMATVIFGLWIEENWAYPIATIVFAITLINIITIYFATQTNLALIFAVLVNVSGLVLTITNTNYTTNWEELETYELKEARKKKK